MTCHHMIGCIIWCYINLLVPVHIHPLFIHWKSIWGSDRKHKGVVTTAATLFSSEQSVTWIIQFSIDLKKMKDSTILQHFSHLRDHKNTHNRTKMVTFVMFQWLEFNSIEERNQAQWHYLKGIMVSKSVTFNHIWNEHDFK